MISKNRGVSCVYLSMLCVSEDVAKPSGVSSFTYLKRYIYHHIYSAEKMSGAGQNKKKKKKAARS